MDLGTLAALVVFLGVGFGGGWAWRARRRAEPRELVVRSSIDELRAIGELSVFKAVSKDLITHSDHTFGEFGRKYLSWAFTKKKLAMVFEFEMDFRYDLRSEAFRIEALGPPTDVGPRPGAPSPPPLARIDLPPCRVEVSIKDLAFYDEQRSRLLPWLLPDLLQGFFDGRFSEDDKNRLIAAARAHAMAQAHGLAERYRAQVERSAYTTLAMLVRPLGFPAVEVRFAPRQELSTDVAAPMLDASEGQPAGAGARPVPTAEPQPAWPRGEPR
ncbi:MAG TPA: DUF4230 domain-containing protein [Burkholderiaceae bacterium]|nr:DUF4230 domain-containing protein [Burkholderiaceae bacterium]